MEVEVRGCGMGGGKRKEKNKKKKVMSEPFIVNNTRGGIYSSTSSIG